MIIQHNITALNSHRQLFNNNIKVAKNLEKLSSGYKINKAGDDAAGLGISEKMRAQIKGLETATQNAKDGISLIQTAEGALHETTDMIQRMRELAVKAANGTYGQAERDKIQDEINQLTAEIDRIGNSTEFNGKKLLNNAVVDEEVYNNIMDGLKNKGWISQAEQRIKDKYGLETNGLKLTIEIKTEGQGGSAAYVVASTGTTTQKMVIDIADFKPSTGDSGDNGTPMYNDRIIAHEMVHALVNANFGTLKAIHMPTWFHEGVAEFIHGADERLKGYIGDGAGNIDTAKFEAIKARGVELLNGGAWGGDSRDYAVAYLLVKYMDKEVGGNGIKDIFADMKANNATTPNGFDLLKNGIASTGKTLDDIKTSFSALTSATATFLHFDAGAETDTGSVGGSDKGGAALNAEDVFDNNTGVTPGTISTMFDVNLIEPPKNQEPLKLQIGASSNETMEIALQDMRAGALKLSSGNAMNKIVTKDGSIASYSNTLCCDSDHEVIYALDVSTQEKAGAALKVYDEALNSVTDFRSKMGALQNRLDHVINNLGVATENMTDSESRIRDVDMAHEMMVYTKNNILTQAAQAMLAQANQLPQGVLQLLR